MFILWFVIFQRLRILLSHNPKRFKATSGYVDSTPCVKRPLQAFPSAPLSNWRAVMKIFLGQKGCSRGGQWTRPSWINSPSVQVALRPSEMNCHMLKTVVCCDSLQGTAQHPWSSPPQCAKDPLVHCHPAWHFRLGKANEILGWSESDIVYNRQPASSAPTHNWHQLLTSSNKLRVLSGTST